MSADSPRRGGHKGAQVITPQPISDRTIIDSVAGIINDIVPQVNTNSSGCSFVNCENFRQFINLQINLLIN